MDVDLRNGFAIAANNDVKVLDVDVVVLDYADAGRRQRIALARRRVAENLPRDVAGGQVFGVVKARVVIVIRRVNFLEETIKIGACSRQSAVVMAASAAP